MWSMELVVKELFRGMSTISISLRETPYTTTYCMYTVFHRPESEIQTCCTLCTHLVPSWPSWHLRFNSWAPGKNGFISHFSPFSISVPSCKAYVCRKTLDPGLWWTYITCCLIPSFTEISNRDKMFMFHKFYKEYQVLLISSLNGIERPGKNHR